MKTREVATQSKVTPHHLADDGTFPNNRLPLLMYRQAFSEESENLADVFEETFRKNGWRGAWRNGVYSYHHYHSTSHEVLGCYSGSARVQFGGDGGAIEELRAGDVVLIPAGVAHKKLSASSVFRVVGAYPAGQEDYDMNTGKRGERPRTDQNIARVALPESDPIFGEQGPLADYWHGQRARK